MRFIKKTSFDNLNEVSEWYKEIELFTTREDFLKDNKMNENIELIREIFNKNKAIITAIHCPSSRWLTSIDREISTNYMSFCEVVSNNDEEILFFKICKFSDEVSKIYNNSKESDSENTKNENNNVSPVKITLILHTGCLLGCFPNKRQELVFDCPFQQTDRKKCFHDLSIMNNKVEEIVRKITEYKSLQIAFENITPYHENENIGDNSGYENENFSLAKHLNKIVKKITKVKDKPQIETKEENSKKKEPKIFGTVIDFCHILATKHLLNKQKTDIEYLKSYLGKLKKEDKELIMLFHLSNYIKEKDIHGALFSESDEDMKILSFIRKWCIENSRSIPITLEVSDEKYAEIGRANFNRLMMEWSKLHVLLQNHLSKELYTFFSDLFTVYSLSYTKKNKNKIFESAQNIRKYILKKSKLDKKLFGFRNEKQEFNIYLFQVQAYIYYMRYVNLAFDLIKKYKDLDVKIDSVLSHYMFNDELEEVKFDGLGCYYNIYWFKNDTLLYRCYDECSGNYEYKESSFKKIILRCFSHINGDYNNTKFLSFSKSFGRVMMKYFDPYKVSKSNGVAYNIEVAKNAPVNYFLIKKDKQIITLQEYQDNPVEYLNFSIDFSDFYNGRGDRSKDASLKELYEKVSKNKKWNSLKIGSIYDHEVIFCNYNSLDVQRYYLSDVDFVIMMIAYKLILKKYNGKTDVECIINSVIKNKERIFDSIDLLQAEEKALKKVNDMTIKEILKIVDFDYERFYSVDVSRDGFTEFTRNFVQVYKGIENMDFYKEIIQEIEKNEKC